MAAQVFSSRFVAGALFARTRLPDPLAEPGWHTNSRSRLGPSLRPMYFVRAVDRNGPQLRHAGHHVNFLAVARRRLPDVLQLGRPLSPGEADVVRTGGHPHASRHPFIDNGLRRGQIGGLNLVVFGTANRRRIHFSSIHGDDEGVRRVVSFHAGVAFLNTADQPARQFILGVSRKNVMDNRAADCSERQSVDVSVLAEFAADGMLGGPGPHLRIAHGHGADALGRVHVSLQQQRRRFQRRRNVVEPEFRAVGGQQVGHVNVDRQQVADCVGIFGAIQTMHDVAARRAVAFPGTIERCSQPARKARVLGFGRTGHARRRHGPHTQLAQDSFPSLRVAQKIVEARRLQIDRALRRIRRAIAVTRDAIFVHERAVFDRFRGCAGLGRCSGLRQQGCVFRARPTPYSDYDLPHCALVTARCTASLSSFPCRRSFLSVAVGSGGG